MTTIAMTKNQDLLHITFGENTVALPITQGFKYSEGQLLMGDHSLACSEKDFKKLSKIYHKTLKPRRSGHAVWALTSFGSVLVITFALLLMGLSSQPLQEEPVADTNVAAEPNPQPEYIAPAPIPSTPSSSTSDDEYFPFGNS